MVDVARPAARAPERFTPFRILAVVVVVLTIVGVARLRPALAEITNETGIADTVRLGTPVEGAAPGQVAVFLRGDAVAGHAIIARG